MRRRHATGGPLAPGSQAIGIGRERQMIIAGEERLTYSEFGAFEVRGSRWFIQHRLARDVFDLDGGVRCATRRETDG